MKIVIGIAAAAALLVAPALAQQQAEPDRQALERLAQDATTAQQLGHLAADKNVPAAVGLLGDSIAVAGAEINLRLSELASEKQAELPQRMDDAAQTRYDELSKLNQEAFVEGFAAMVVEVYPRLIAGAERVGEAAGIDDDLRQRLDKHLEAARQLSEGGEIDQQTAEALRQEGPMERKRDPATTSGDEAPGGRQ